MKKEIIKHLAFEIDKLTNSIQNIITGDSFDTEVSNLLKTELKLLKKSEWLFNWQQEFENKDKEIYKLTIVNNTKIIQGLISIEDRKDHVFMHLIESTKFNKGKNKMYFGVAGNLIAFACKRSKEKGYNGVVSFFAKTKLIEHYKESLGAKVLFGNQMIIDELNAKRLIFKYFKT